MGSIKEDLADKEHIKPAAIGPNIKYVITTARDSVFGGPEQIDRRLNEYDTTLLTGVVTLSGVVGALVGDGGLVCDTGDNYELHIPREDSVVNLEISNIIFPLLSQTDSSQLPGSHYRVLPNFKYSKDNRSKHMSSLFFICTWSLYSPTPTEETMTLARPSRYENPFAQPVYVDQELISTE